MLRRLRVRDQPSDGVGVQHPEHGHTCWAPGTRRVGGALQHRPGCSPEPDLARLPGDRLSAHAGVVLPTQGAGALDHLMKYIPREEQCDYAAEAAAAKG